MTENTTPNVVPAEPTEAQQEQQVEQGDIDPGTGLPLPSEEAREQARQDAQFRAEHPNEPVARDANPAVAGESNDYLGNVND